MFTLERENSRFYRVKHGQSDDEVRDFLQAPAPGLFAGAIVSAGSGYAVYVAKPFDSFAGVARMFGVDEKSLEKLNYGGAVYPTRKIYIPRG